MKKYKVCIPIEAEATIIVEADSEVDARADAIDQGLPCLCGDCGDMITISDFGSEENITVKEMAGNEIKPICKLCEMSMISGKGKVTDEDDFVCSTCITKLTARDSIYVNDSVVKININKQFKQRK